MQTYRTLTPTEQDDLRRCERIAALFSIPELLDWQQALGHVANRTLACRIQAVITDELGRRDPLMDRAMDGDR